MKEYWAKYKKSLLFFIIGTIVSLLGSRWMWEYNASFNWQYFVGLIGFVTGIQLIRISVYFERKQ